jgi:hypothetical protein
MAQLLRSLIPKLRISVAILLVANSITNLEANTLTWQQLAVTIPSTVCYQSSGTSSTGQQDCTGGEVQLLGNYLHVGVHNVGSFGTSNTLDSSYYTGQLGIIADFDKDGFATSSPGYSGDFTVAGSTSLEGAQLCHCNPDRMTNHLNSPSRLDRAIREQRQHQAHIHRGGSREQEGRDPRHLPRHLGRHSAVSIVGGQFRLAGDKEGVPAGQRQALYHHQRRYQEHGIHRDHRNVL